MVRSARAVSTTSVATTYYPAAIRQISLSRPKELTNWDFLLVILSVIATPGV